MSYVSMRTWNESNPQVGDSVEHDRIGDGRSFAFTVPQVGETVKIVNHRRSYMIGGARRFLVGTAEFVLLEQDRYAVETPFGTTGETTGVYRRTK